MHSINDVARRLCVMADAKQRRGKAASPWRPSEAAARRWPFAALRELVDPLLAYAAKRLPDLGRTH